MTSILTLAKREIKDMVTPLGFRSYKQHYYRVVGNVVQGFCIFTNHHNCTSRFYIEPLSCMGERDIEGPFELDDFDPNFIFDQKSGTYMFQIRSAFYTMKDEKSVETAVKSLKIRLENYLLPFFQKSETNENAYEGFCYANDCSHVRDAFFDYQRKFFCLITKRYEEAEKYQENHVNNIRNNLKKLLENELNEENNKRKQKEECLKKNMFILDKITSKDEDWISEYLYELENKRLETLKWKRKDIIVPKESVESKIGADNM